jgi:para-aminobenzoate synthetase component 1
MTDSHISVSLDQSGFDGFAGRLARLLGADLVLSVDGHPSATTSLAGVRPVSELVFSQSTTPGEVKRFCFGSPGLALGFISYTYGLGLRGVTSSKQASFPLGHLKKYAAVVEYDAKSGQATVTSDDARLRAEILALVPKTEEAPGPLSLPVAPPEVSLNQAGYEAGVRRTLEHILSGHTYQLNLSTRFTWQGADLDPLALFLALRRAHPAPFYAWLTSGNHRVLSTSPERFLRVEGGEVLSQPIKGTLRFDTYRPELADALTASPKESAELSMIVDLLRNDVSANCEYGSVRVSDHSSVFRVDNLLQMYANVHGRLRQGRDCLDLFFDAFPGGSVTGCPKLSSMRIIEELEPHDRGVYCGSVVVIRDEQTMDSSIAIRTGTYDTATKTLHTYAGSGIVVDSDPSSEYQETMAKAEKFLTLGES